MDNHETRGLSHAEYGLHDAVWRSGSEPPEHNEHDPHTEEDKISISSQFGHTFVRFIAADVPSVLVHSVEFTASNSAM